MKVPLSATADGSAAGALALPYQVQQQASDTQMQCRQRAPVTACRVGEGLGQQGNDH